MLRATIVTCAILCSSCAPAQIVIEDFEGAFPDSWVTVGTPHVQVPGGGLGGSTGIGGLVPAGWVYNTNTTVQAGDRVSFWTYPLNGNATWLGVDAGAGGCKSFVFSTITDEIRIEDNAGYVPGLTVTATNVTWNCCVWYRMEVEQQAGGTLVGRLFDAGGGLLGQLSWSFGALGGGGVALRVGWGDHFGDDLAYQPSAQVPECAITTPVGGATVSGDVDVRLDADDSQGNPLTLLFEVSTDLGQTYLPMTPSASSPLANPASGIATPASAIGFTWDSYADGVGLSGAWPARLRVRASDGARETQCRVALQVDKGFLCGDCDQNGVGPNIVDALTAALIGAGLLQPTVLQELACDVNGSTTVNILDALWLAQMAAGLAVTPTCPGGAPPVGTKLYVLAGYPAELRVFDLAGGSHLGTLVLPDLHVACVADPVRLRLYLTSNTVGAEISVVDTTTDSLAGSFAVGDLAPDHLAITPDGSALVGLTRTSGELLVLDLPAGTLRHAIAIPGATSFADIQVSPSSLSAWTIDIAGGAVARVDLQGGTLVSSTPISGSYPSSIGLSDSGATLYVTMAIDEELIRIDTATNLEIAPRQATGVLPIEVFGHPAGNAFVMNMADQAVAEHDGATGQLLRQFPVGVDPQRVRLCPSGELAVVNATSNSVTLIDPVAGTTRAVTGLTYPIDVAAR